MLTVKSSILISQLFNIYLLIEYFITVHSLPLKKPSSKLHLKSQFSRKLICNTSDNGAWLIISRSHNNFTYYRQRIYNNERGEAHGIYSYTNYNILKNNSQLINFQCSVLFPSDCAALMVMRL